MKVCVSGRECRNRSAGLGPGTGPQTSHGRPKPSSGPAPIPEGAALAYGEPPPLDCSPIMGCNPALRRSTPRNLGCSLSLQGLQLCLHRTSTALPSPGTGRSGDNRVSGVNQKNCAPWRSETPHGPAYFPNPQPRPPLPAEASATAATTLHANVNVITLQGG